MKKNQATTIKIHNETKERLDRLREGERESYEEILRKILFILNTSKTNPQKARSLMHKIDRSRKDKDGYNKVYQKSSKNDGENQEEEN
jgi:predicted transcriptional regulator